MGLMIRRVGSTREAERFDLIAKVLVHISPSIAFENDGMLAYPWHLYDHPHFLIVGAGLLDGETM